MKKLLKRLNVPAINAFEILLSIVMFLLGYIVCAYSSDSEEAPNDTDMREDPLKYHQMQDENYGFYKR